MSASILYYARRYDQAIRKLQSNLEIEPGNWASHLILGRVYLHSGRFSEALAEFQKAKQAERQIPEITASLGLAYALIGKQAEAHKILAGLEDQYKTGYVGSENLALVCLGLGDNDRAFAWLEKAYNQRSPELLLIQVDPDFDSIRSEIRYRDMLRRAGLLQ